MTANNCSFEYRGHTLRVEQLHHVIDYNVWIEEELRLTCPRFPELQVRWGLVQKRKEDGTYVFPVATPLERLYQHVQIPWKKPWRWYHRLREVRKLAKHITKDPSAGAISFIRTVRRELKSE